MYTASIGKSSKKRLCRRLDEAVANILPRLVCEILPIVALCIVEHLGLKSSACTHAHTSPHTHSPPPPSHTHTHTQNEHGVGVGLGGLGTSLPSFLRSVRGSKGYGRRGVQRGIQGSSQWHRLDCWRPVRGVSRAKGKHQTLAMRKGEGWKGGASL